jgi:2-polyprenyl-6-methoxyphenol hydroxylase-like FAD-dependent oxidoreductase
MGQTASAATTAGDRQIFSPKDGGRPVKIAINGAGIAGPALAYWLWRYGHEPVLIEKSLRLRTGGYVIDFWGGGYKIAERMGLTGELHASGYEVDEVRLLDGNGRKVGGFAADVFRRNLDDRFVSLPRGDLAAMIYRSIDGQVETLFGEQISSIEHHDSGVDVEFERGRPRRFDLLIGAGGIHSPVRALAFGADEKFEKRLGYRVAAFEADGYQPRDELVYVAYCVPGRMVARFALHNDRTLFLFVFVDDHTNCPDPLDPGRTKTVLRDVFAELGWECPQILQEAQSADDIYFDQVSQIITDSWSCGRVALIGDAAGAVSFLAGEGAGLAMMEAYVLAGELATAGNDHREAFRRYERQLRPLVEAKQKSARRFACGHATTPPNC